VNKKAFWLVGALLSAGVTFASHPQNYALELGAQSYVDCGNLDAINNLDAFTVQFWMNPSSWSEGAKVLSRGQNFSVSLGAQGSIVVVSGESTVTVSDANLLTNTWAQVTIIRTPETTKVYVNNVEAVVSSTLSAIPAEDGSLTIGGGFVGRIDEVRVWKAAIADDFERFTFNTLNKWCPQWDDLVVYYKMDQVSCANIVDYKKIIDATIDEDKKALPINEWRINDGSYNNHGIMMNGAKRVLVTDNTKMPYLINAGYCDNNRFYDRTVPQDQYLLNNEIIMLGINCETNGHLTFRTPVNHGTLKGDAKWLESFEGRDGVVSFDGNGSIEINDDVMASSSNYTFMAWVYVDEWTNGAYIFRKETEDGKNGFSVSLDEFEKSGVTSKVVKVRVNGICWRISDALKVGEWNHIAIVPKGGTSASQTFTFVVNGTAKTMFNTWHDGGTDYVPTGNDDCVGYVGEGFKGKLDEFVIYQQGLSTSDIASFKDKGMDMPTLENNASADRLSNADTYYKFDDGENPGWDYHSQEHWLKLQRDAYEGYNTPTMTISVRTPGGSDGSGVLDLINSADSRERFARELAELSKSFDGVELDLEWVYGSNWNNYAVMGSLIRQYLPADKTFNVSTHNVTYAYPTSKMSDVSAFTFQQYGPQSNHFGFTHFQNMVNAFLNYGYPADKIMTSYSTTTSNGSGGSPIKGVKDGFIPDSYELTNADTEYCTFSGENYYFTGPMQTYNRGRVTREKNLAGIFYWDMGNDYWVTNDSGKVVMPKYNLAKYCSYSLNSNIDPVITEVEVNHTAGVDDIISSVDGIGNANSLKADINGRSVKFTENVRIVNMLGATVAVADANKTVTLDNGVYVAVSNGAKLKFIIK
jgi:hypothetical protein